MSIISSQKKKKEANTVNYQNIASKNLLLIFTRNPELGKCKSRLAATVGNEIALNIYKFLLNHTFAITKNVNAAKQVWYSEKIWKNDIWNNHFFDKKLQEGANLGIRMANAFSEGFTAGFERIIIIGSDMYDLTQKDIDHAFSELENSDFVVGPAEDGGYYLLGMNTFNTDVFKNKAWGTKTVLEATLKNINHKKIKLLETKNDIDLYEDIAKVDAFKPFIKHLTK